VAKQHAKEKRNKKSKKVDALKDKDDSDDFDETTLETSEKLKTSIGKRKLKMYTNVHSDSEEDVDLSDMETTSLFSSEDEEFGQKTIRKLKEKFSKNDGKTNKVADEQQSSKKIDKLKTC
jgi:hypothetical protein